MIIAEFRNDCDNCVIIKLSRENCDNSDNRMIITKRHIAYRKIDITKMLLRFMLMCYVLC